MVRRSGRRPGNQDTRQSILDAARAMFAERGFDQTTIRAIATEAKVDPALVHHYFGTKDKLFLAAMNLPIDPGELIAKAVDGDRAEVGRRLVRMFLTVWDGPAGAAGVALLRSAVGSEWTAKLFREFVVTQIMRRLTAKLALDPSEAPLRISLAASQMAGVGIVRYVLKVEPLASVPREVLVAAISPTVQRYLTGDLSEAVNSSLLSKAQPTAHGRHPA